MVELFPNQSLAVEALDYLFQPTGTALKVVVDVPPTF
jgi:hypothetical protein